MRFLNLLRRCPRLTRKRARAHFSGSEAFITRMLGSKQFLSTEPELEDVMNYLDSLKNYEKSGVPKGAGTDSEDGFDMGRIRRLMDRLGNPHNKFKAIHIAGTKGKGSTAAFISSILRAEGYYVGCYTSPHILTIRERMSLGKFGEPVPAEMLNCIFQKIRPKLDEAIHQENGSLSHFEVLTATAFFLFAEEKIDIAVIEAGLGGARDATNIICSSGLAASVITTIGEEHLAALGGSLESIAMAKAGIIKRNRPVILGGPFLPSIEKILRDKAYMMQSPVISASDPGVKTTIKTLNVLDGRPYQFSDISIKMERDFQLSIRLSDLKMHMLGSHQLQNASTATCIVLCLRDQGWRISDRSVRTGIENTCLIGRCQFLSFKESEALGLPGATILLDGAHTKESAKALMDTIRMSFPEAKLGFVVAMASDKDHLAFAKEVLSGGQVDAVFLTEAEIAGGKFRTTSAPLLRDRWIKAAKELNIGTIHDTMAEYQDLLKGGLVDSRRDAEERIIIAAENSLEVSMKHANEILGARARNQPILVVTGSLHILSSVLASSHK
ncbi:hypothetical protein K2173_001420 [Erythroxylum novogranatense]|uniref:Mur ligase central domain-containing protein n=1 Tax=Erythroxylum novogranatense TaxID=1862640 RepID=A0AAV8S7D0_9ROSI|nr:hypothetical protein K2173_001420 [Erythroxylum novogranatense]